MKIAQISASYRVYEEASELPEEDQVLLQLAKKSLEKSYSPYSHFKVGAAALLKNGKMIGGSNQENASYPLCICAERVVLGSAGAQYPDLPVTALAVSVKTEKKPVERPGAPCGACRQVICESESRHQYPMRIILQGETGEVWVFNSGADLLPLAFDGSLL